MPGPFAESQLVNRNFRDILLALSAEGVEFLIVGAFALAFAATPSLTVSSRWTGECIARLRG